VSELDLGRGGAAHGPDRGTSDAGGPARATPGDETVTDGGTTDAGHGPGGGARRRRHRPGRAPRPSLARTAAYALSFALIWLAVLLVPLPYVEYAPGRPAEIPPMIELSGAEVTEIEGSTHLLTVFLRDATTFSAARVLLDPSRELTPASRVAPGGLTPEFFQAQQDTFARTFEIAAAVGAQAAGLEVDHTTEVRVADVLADSPADGVLAVGDRLLAVDGEPLLDAAQLQARTRTAEPGDELALTIDHAGAERTVTVVLQPLGGGEQVGLGVMAETATVGLDLPFEVSLNSTRIGGPSAGMMTALTIYDLLAEEDLVAGRAVHGTGSISISGRVGPVGGVPEKVRAAAADGADVVLVPAPQLEAAERAAPDGLRVVGVATLDEALDALRTTS
jgi:Lon-like protease